MSSCSGCSIDGLPCVPGDTASNKPYAVADTADSGAPTAKGGLMERGERMFLLGVGFLSAVIFVRSLSLISSGQFADEWDAERDAGYPNLQELRERHAGAAVQ